MSKKRHHPDCEFTSFADPGDLEWAKQATRMTTHKPGPVLAAAVERGRELAERLGWA